MMNKILKLIVSLPVEILNAAAAGPKVAYKMEKKQDSADIYLYDVIGDSWEGTTAKQFASDLKALGEMKALNIFINSEGGSVFDGVAIYNVLRRNKATKNVQIDGLAASIASVIAMAGDKIQIAKNGIMMIHDPWAAGFIVGTAADFRDTGNKIADSLDKIREAILATYVERTGNQMKEISDWMKAESWFTADEAVANGFADSVTEHAVDVAALARHDFTKFKNIPSAIKDAVARGTSTAFAEEVANILVTAPATVTATETATKFAAIAERKERLANLALDGQRPA